MTLDELENEIRGLSREDSLRLFERLGLGEAAKMLLANIRIHDLFEEDRKKPRAVIEYEDGTEESIDILESIRNNAASIGHPAILLAIRRWEQIIRYHSHGSLHPNVEYLNLFRSKPLKFEHGELVEIATNHIESVTAAILKGAVDRALTKEALLVMSISFLGYDTNFLYLREAWKLLGSKEIKKKRRDEEKLAWLRQQLEIRGDDHLMFQHPNAENFEEEELREQRDKYLINPIIDFLSSSYGERLLSKRGTWRAIFNEFNSWRSGIEKDSVKNYRSKAKRQANNRKSVGRDKANECMYFGYSLDASAMGEKTADSNHDLMAEDMASFFDDCGYSEDAALDYYFIPEQLFEEGLDIHSLIPDDPNYFLFMEIASYLSVPYPLSTYHRYLQYSDSWFQALRAWLLLPCTTADDK